MIIPTPRARKLRDMHEGFPRSHSRPVASDPASALIVTMLCCYRWASLGPSPLSDPHPVTSQIPVGTLFWGHWDTLFDCNLLSHGWWGRAPGFHLPKVRCSLQLGPFRLEVSTRSTGVLAGFPRTLFPLVINMGFLDNAGGVGRWHGWGSDGRGSDLALSDSCCCDQGNLTSCVHELLTLLLQCLCRSIFNRIFSFPLPPNKCEL